MTPDQLMNELREMLDQQVKQGEADYSYAMFRERGGERYVMHMRPEDWGRILETAKARREAFVEIERR